MILFLVAFLEKYTGIRVPAVFGYYSTRMMLAAVTGLCLSIFLGPWFVRKLYELKIGQPIRTEECPLLGHLHRNKRDTPTMGGILILFAMIVSLFLWMNLQHVFTLILLITTLWFGFLGGYDDYLKLRHRNTKGLSGRKKLLAQLLLGALIGIYFLVPHVAEGLQMGNWFAPPFAKEQIATIAKNVDEVSGTPVYVTLQASEYVGRLYLPFMKNPLCIFSGVGLVVIFLLIMVTITGSSNAVNLTDGLDGLASGCLMLVAATYAMVAFVSNNIDFASYLWLLYIEGSGEIAIYLCALAGACLGFLWFNGHPAQVFMGDTGSLALGGVIGVSAVLLARELLLVIVGGIFVAEAASVMLQVASYKWRNKKRIFLCTPLHHHFEYKGWAEPKIVLRFWIVGLLLALVGAASLKFQ